MGSNTHGFFLDCEQNPQRPGGLPNTCPTSELWSVKGCERPEAVSGYSASGPHGHLPRAGPLANSEYNAAASSGRPPSQRVCALSCIQIPASLQSSRLRVSWRCLVSLEGMAGFPFSGCRDSPPDRRQRFLLVKGTFRFGIQAAEP